MFNTEVFATWYNPSGPMLLIQQYAFNTTSATPYHSLTFPTAFGFANGKIQMGGEAGAEAILPLSAFWRNLQAYTENSQKKSQGNNDININVTINAENANEEEMAARFINIVVPEIKRQYAIL